jgi:hypothetical protein
MYHSGKNPLKRVARNSEEVQIPKGLKVRRLHKAFLRYHDANNWPVLREALRRMGRADLIGNGKHQLIPAWQPAGTGQAYEGHRSRDGAGMRDSGKGKRSAPNAVPGMAQRSAQRTPSGDRTTPFRTQHTGLPYVPGDSSRSPKPSRGPGTSQRPRSAGGKTNRR